MCYSNSVTNALLSSERITSNLQPHHCLCCDFLYEMKQIGHHPPVQSSFLLKSFVSTFKPQFQGSKQQDVSEYTETILTHCKVLNTLSQMIVRITRICTKCRTATSSDDRRNILLEDLEGNSIIDLIPSIQKRCLNFLAHCTICMAEKIHEKYELLLELPDVLIVQINRFQRNQFNRIIGKNCKDIDPSIILQPK